MFTITLEIDGKVSKVFEFDTDEVRIGRDPQSEIHLASSNVSKRHARIVTREGKHFIVDRKSTNGTFVNGTRVTTPVVLKDGDSIFMGDFVMQFSMGKAGDVKVERSKTEPPPLPKSRAKTLAAAPALDLDDETQQDEVQSPEPPKPAAKPPEPPKAPEPPKPAANPPEPPKAPEPPQAQAPEEDLVEEDAAFDAPLAGAIFSALLDHELFADAEDIFSPEFASGELTDKAEAVLTDLLGQTNGALTDGQRELVKNHVLGEVFGFGPVTDVLESDEVHAALLTSDGTVVVRGEAVINGFSCPDAFMLAAARLSALAQGEEMVKNELVSVLLEDHALVRIRVAERGVSWIQVMKLPVPTLDLSVPKGRELKDSLAKGGVVLAGSSCRRGRAALAAAVADVVAKDGRLVVIGLEEIDRKGDIIYLPELNDGLDLADRLSEAYALNAAWVLVDAPATADTAIIDLLNHTFKGLLWTVPAPDGARALRAVKNALVYQAAANVATLETMLKESISLVVSLEHGEKGPVLTKVEKP